MQAILAVLLVALGIVLERRSARYEREREAALAAAREEAEYELIREENAYWEWVDEYEDEQVGRFEKREA